MNHDINFKNGPVVIQEGYGSEPYHFHQNAQELIWVLEGEAGITFNNVEYILNAEDDVILLVDSDAHMIRKISDNLRYLSFYIDLPYFQTSIRDILHVGLYCNPGYRPAEQLPYLAQLRNLLAQIVWEYCMDENSPKVIDVTSRLLLLLRNHFNFLGTTSLDYKDPDTFDRLFKVYDFIYEHYKERVTLSDLAAQIHVSRSYLSRSIKQITGMGFKDILNYVRCEEAVRLLLGSDRSITAIAYDCGFSDPKYFNQYFTTFFHANPVEFRKQHKKNTDIDYMIHHQKPVIYDDALKNSLNRYWKVLDISSSKPVSVSFDTEATEVGGRPIPPLCVLTAATDFENQTGSLQLLAGLQEAFPQMQLKVLPQETINQLPVFASPVQALHHALETGEILLSAPKSQLTGLFAPGGIRTPLYYMLLAACHLGGTWSLAENWALGRANGNQQQMLLLAWNESSEKNLEFHLEFSGEKDRCLILKHEFPAALPAVLFQLEKENLTDFLSTASGPFAPALFHPSCTAEICNITEYGFPFKIHAGTAGMLSVTRL